jgi:hypothetical protein
VSIHGIVIVCIASAMMSAAGGQTMIDLFFGSRRYIMIAQFK